MPAQIKPYPFRICGALPPKSLTRLGRVTRCVSSPEGQMSKRTAKFVSALFVSLAAGTPLATVSHGATDAADSCLSATNGFSPQGGHWYYRDDRATKRNCWYLKAEGEKASRAAP